MSSKICTPLAGFIAISALLNGCASTPSQRLAESPKAPAHKPQTAARSESAAERIDFTTPQSNSVAKPEPVPSNMMQIGLYGEVTGGIGANGGLPFDGDSNLAQISFATEGACIDPDVDRTGTWLAFASTMHRKTSDIYIKSVTGKTQTQLTTDPADDAMPSFSPDGKTVAFASNRSGNWDIYATGISESGRNVQITNDADHELHPTWSPDGRMVAYCKFGSQSQRWEIWVTDSSNPGVRHFLDYGVFPQWCPDPARNKILFQRSKQRGSRDYSIWTVDYINGQAMHPTEIVSAANAALINPSWSPDGSRIVFVAVVDPEQSPKGVLRNRMSGWSTSMAGPAPISPTASSPTSSLYGPATAFTSFPIARESTTSGP